MKHLLNASLSVAFLVGASSPGWADAAAGKAAFEAKGCTACHYTEGPAREKTIDDQLAKKGPELWYAGSKFQKDWLAGWLADPKPIRPYWSRGFNGTPSTQAFPTKSIMFSG